MPNDRWRRNCRPALCALFPPHRPQNVEANALRSWCCRCLATSSSRSKRCWTSWWLRDGSLQRRACARWVSATSIGVDKEAMSSDARASASAFSFPSRREGEESAPTRWTHQAAVSGILCAHTVSPSSSRLASRLLLVDALLPSPSSGPASLEAAAASLYD